MLKYNLVAFAFFLLSMTSADAYEVKCAGVKTTVQNSDFAAPRELVLSLIRTDRNKRSWKTLWIKPGSERTWFYSYLMPDGSVITKEATHKLKGIRDERSLNEKRPNVYVFLQLANLSIPSSLGAITALAGAKGKL